MSIEFRLVLALLCVLVVTLFGVYIHHEIYDEGLSAGRMQVQAQWDQDRASIAKLETAQQEAAHAKEAAAAATDKGVHDAYESQIAALSTAASDYAGRLRGAQGRLPASGNPVSSVPGGPGLDSGTATSGQGRLIDAVGRRLAECDANEAQLIALGAEVRTQL